MRGAVHHQLSAETWIDCYWRSSIGVAREELSFVDGRYLPSDCDHARITTTRYISRLVDMIAPKIVAMEAARQNGSQTTVIVHAAVDVLAEHRVNVVPVNVDDVLSAFGLPGLHSRRELRGLLTEIFPELNDRGAIKPYIMDAAATALFVESSMALGLLTT